MSFIKDKIEKKIKHAGAKNMIRGFLFAAIYLTITLIIPYLTFQWIRNLEVEGESIDIYKDSYQSIIFWVVAFGLLISGTAFCAYSSPAQSIRRGVWSLVQVILNCFYLWSYKFSGALEVEFTIVDVGALTINLTQMILLYMGIYFLTIILKTYDLIDFIVNRENIKLERGKK